ncbi:phage virion morphogenesis protein [Brevibacillus composti]|uniref:Phage virion morphogenesis protein n=1 Tax=Brevibacillus composti TaxID=2796470 RepID=A0ABX7ZA27_9BACL|nr:phage virion morphogenesis protein [Brevibacillus composti]QUO43452.1 phage virion morphogenesis protein [Brevibacillus composti]
MATEGVRIEGDWSRLFETLRNLNLSKSELRMLNAQIAQIVAEGSKGRFESEKSPEGERWEPLSPATLEARARRRTRRKDGTSGYRTKRGKLSKRAERIIASGRPLKDTGRLMRSIATKATAEGAAIGTNLVQAAIQQLGGQAGRGKKVEIPARPYLGVSSSEEADIMELIQEFIRERVQ